MIGLATDQHYLNMSEQIKTLLDKNIIKYDKVKWGSGYRTVLLINGKKYQYTMNKNISKILQNKINQLYIQYNMSSNQIVIEDLVGDDGEDNKKPSRKERIRRRRATLVIQKGFRNNRLTLKIDEIRNSLNNKVKVVKIVPEVMGKNKRGDILAILNKASKLAEKEMGKKNYKVYIYVKIRNDNGDPVEASTNKYNKGNEEEMLNDVLHKIEWQIQSATTVLLKDLEIYFNYIEIPTGGAYTTSTAREDILNKSSVVKVVNNDDNCFWYALTNLIYSNHARVKEIRMGRKIRTNLAKELCEKCGFEWDKQISIEDIPIIEGILEINISVLDIDNLPVLNSTTNIYNSLMYKKYN